MLLCFQLNLPIPFSLGDCIRAYHPYTQEFIRAKIVDAYLTTTEKQETITSQTNNTNNQVNQQQPAPKLKRRMVTMLQLLTGEEKQESLGKIQSIAAQVQWGEFWCAEPNSASILPSSLLHDSHFPHNPFLSHIQLISNPFPWYKVGEEVWWEVKSDENSEIGKWIGGFISEENEHQYYIEPIQTLRQHDQNDDNDDIEDGDVLDEDTQFVNQGMFRFISKKERKQRLEERKMLQDEHEEKHDLHYDKLGLSPRRNIDFRSIDTTGVDEPELALASKRFSFYSDDLDDSAPSATAVTFKQSAFSAFPVSKYKGQWLNKYSSRIRKQVKFWNELYAKFLPDIASQPGDDTEMAKIKMNDTNSQLSPLASTTASLLGVDMTGRRSMLRLPSTLSFGRSQTSNSILSESEDFDDDFIALQKRLRSYKSTRSLTGGSVTEPMSPRSIQKLNDEPWNTLIQSAWCKVKADYVGDHGRKLNGKYIANSSHTVLKQLSNCS